MEIESVHKAIAGIEEGVRALRLALVPVGLVERLAAITPTGSFPLGRDDQITEPGGNGCTVRVQVTVRYELRSTRNEVDANGRVIRTCTTYRITVTVTVSEERCPEGVAPMPPRTTSHVFEKEYCGGDHDTVGWGETVGFDRVKTQTLTYTHGTRVTVVTGRPPGKTTITVRFPDGTEVSTVVP